MKRTSNRGHAALDSEFREDISEELASEKITLWEVSCAHVPWKSSSGQRRSWRKALQQEQQGALMVRMKIMLYLSKHEFHWSFYQLHHNITQRKLTLRWGWLWAPRCSLRRWMLIICPETLIVGFRNATELVFPLGILRICVCQQMPLLLLGNNSVY